MYSIEVDIWQGLRSYKKEKYNHFDNADGITLDRTSYKLAYKMLYNQVSQ
jgi:hypothetical protein